MLIGYARVSTDDQKLDLQRDAFAKAGVLPDDIYTDEMSGVRRKRPGLELALKRLRDGDVFVVWRLDRLGRSVRELIDRVEQIKAAGCQFRSLTETIDTVSAGGKLMFHVFAAVAEFERNLLIERTYAGMAAAAARGRKGGRKHYLNDAQLEQMKILLADTDDPLDDIAAQFGIKRRTINNYVDGGRAGLRHRIELGEEVLNYGRA
jgi:DNA invertase Pin-like site-specific DNA recombinase